MKNSTIIRSIWKGLFLLFFTIGTLSKATVAQSIVHRMYYYDPGLVIGGGFGPSISFSDIKQNIIFPASKPMSEWRFSGQFHLEFEVTPVFSLRGQLAYGYIAGARPTANRFFKAKLLEANSSILVRPVSLFIPYRTDYKWHPYLIIGIGLSYYNSTLTKISDNETIAQRGFGNGSGLWGYVIEGIALGGIGVSYHLNENWSIRLETSNRWMNSDKLDTVESIDRSPYDFYNFTTLGISYKIFKKRHYPMVNKKS